jgi:hypothetical protein
VSIFWWVVGLVLSFWLGVGFYANVRGAVTTLHYKRVTEMAVRYAQIAHHSIDGRIDANIVIHDLNQLRGGLQDADRPARGRP